MHKNTLPIVSMVLAIWSLLTSWMWVYYINLFVSLPAAILSYFLIVRFRKAQGDTSVTKIVPRILIAAILVAAGVLLFIR